MAKMGRPRKEIFINVKEFVDMLKYIKSCPVDRIYGLREDDVPIPDTGKAYWGQALDQVVECLNYIHDATPLTSAKRVIHEKKISQYGDDRLKIYEYIRTEIIEKHGGSNTIHEE